MSHNVLGQEVSDDTTGQLADQGTDQFDYAAFAEANIGEGKRYQNAEDALKALAKKTAHQDTFIGTLKLENQGQRSDIEVLKTKLGESKKLDDLMALLVDPSTTPAKGDDSPKHTQEDIQKLIQQALDAQRQHDKDNEVRATYQQNQDKAFKLLAAEGGFGSEANAKRAILQYVGQSSEREKIINELGSIDPEGVVHFLKSQVKLDNPMPGTGGTKLNVGAVAADTGQLTWEKVKLIKKENPELYKSRSFQLKIHQAAAANPNFWK